MARLEPYLQPNWDWRAAGNFIGGGTGSGLIIAASWAWLDAYPYYVFALLALAFIGAGLLCVWAEIGKPLRALHVYFHPQTSWMTREAITAIPLGLTVLTAAMLEFINLESGKTAVFVLIALIFALAYLYCQGNILKASKGIPAWRINAILTVIATTGLAEGFAVLAIGAVFVDGPNPWLGVILAILAVSRAGAWINYLYELNRQGAPAKALEALVGITRQTLAWGHGLPTLLAVIAALEPALSLWLNAAAGLLILAAGWWMKVVIITRASYNQGFALPVLPVRGAKGLTGSSKPGWTPPRQ